MRRDFVIGVGSALALVLIVAWINYPRSFEKIDGAATPVRPAPPVTVGNQQVPVEHQVPVRVIETGTHAVDGDQQANYAAYNTEGFLKLWKYAYGATKLMPEIDFSKEYVIGVFAGKRLTGGYVVTVSSITDNGRVRNVTVRLTKPGEGCAVTEALSAPFQIVAVPLNTTTLTHSNVEVAEACS